jgi:hypothetical protein
MVPAHRWLLSHYNAAIAARVRRGYAVVKNLGRRSRGAVAGSGTAAATGRRNQAIDIDKLAQSDYFSSTLG